MTLALEIIVDEDIIWSEGEDREVLDLSYLTLPAQEGQRWYTEHALELLQQKLLEQQPPDEAIVDLIDDCQTYLSQLT